VLNPIYKCRGPFSSSRHHLSYDDYLEDKMKNKNSSGDEIANVNFCTTTTYMLPAPTPVDPTC